MIYVPTIGIIFLNTDKVPQVTKIFHSELFLKVCKKKENSHLTMPAFWINLEKKNNHTISRITNKQRMITRALSESSFIHHGHLSFCKPTLWVLVWDHIRLSSIGKQGMDRKSDRALRDRENCGKKDPLSESVDHTLGDRDPPDYFESRQVLKEWSLGTTVNVKKGILSIYPDLIHSSDHLDFQPTIIEAEAPSVLIHNSRPSHTSF